MSVDDEGVEEETLTQFPAIDGNALHACGDGQLAQHLAGHVEDADAGITGVIGKVEADGGLLVEGVRGVLVENSITS